MTNRIIGAFLMMLLLYVMAVSTVHHHPAQNPAPEACVACFWHACGLMEAAPVSVSVVVAPESFIPVNAYLDGRSVGCRTCQQTRAPPRAA